MSTETLKVLERSQKGSAASRKLRRDGQIPAILYGHGGDSLSLTVDAGALAMAVRHGAHLVTLEGAANETALVSEVQWDAMGSQILHLDLMRVRADEQVELEVPLVLRGDAPGTKQGGSVELHLHNLSIGCQADAIPENIEVRIHSLELNQAIHVSDLELPEGVTARTPGDVLVTNCIEPTEASEEVAQTSGMEPEVIGGAKEDESED